MSGGPDSIRGYLVQTLVALLQGLDDRDWLSVTLEPDHVSQKIDILWRYGDRTKADQVKSSKNLFQKADVEKWADDLAASKDADEYELILVGEAGPAVREIGQVGKVRVPPPRSLDLDASIERAAHRLDRFLASQNVPTGSPDYREMVAHALVGKLARLSAGSCPFQRTELIEQLKRWVAQEIPVFPIFNCPARNPWFTGRDKEITVLHERLHETGKAAIGQAISGLGGIGKTQTAIQYAHKYRDEYDAVFLVLAATELDMRTAYAKIACTLRLPHDPKDSDGILAAVKRWLESVDSHAWLLVFDNADDPPLLKPFFPSKAPKGHIIVTSRVRVLDAIGFDEPLPLEKLPDEDAICFLLRRAPFKPDDEIEQRAARELVRELDGLPLALEQAAAYILAMQVTYVAYTESYRVRKLELLEEREPVTGDYREMVATTWLMNFEQVEARSKASADLVQLSAILDPNRIPFELLVEGAKELGPHLCEAISPSDPLSVSRGSWSRLRASRSLHRQGRPKFQHPSPRPRGRQGHNGRCRAGHGPNVR